MGELEQQKVIDLDRGLFFINYKSAEDISAPPRVLVSAAQGHEQRMEFILHPDATEPILWGPKSGLVVRVGSPGRLQVEVSPTRPGGSRAAVVGIEPIQSGQPARTAYQPLEARHVTTQSLQLLGHVAGIGDVVVGPNAWIAGPSSPSRIEGFALEWPDKPAGIDIRYAVQFANAQPGSGKMVTLGTFAGSRGRALALTGVVLELIGSDDLQFSAEAIFLSAPTLRAIGRRVVLSGPTGRETLVGLRVTVEPVGSVSGAEDPVTPAQSLAATRSGRVRVFRSKPRVENAIG